MQLDASLESEPLVSIIVPVYNSARYLPTLLDSLQQQTYHNLEFVCLNDGSKDDSLNILKERASEDNRFVIIDKENSGAAKTRNLGIDYATGEYLCFVDSDDYVVPSAFEMLVRAAMENEADAVIFDMGNFDDTTGETSPTNAVETGRVPARTVFSIADVDNFYKRIVGFTVNKLYRTAYLRNLDLHFPLIGAHEDMPFTYIALSAAARLFYLDETLYYYRRSRDGSLSDRTNDDYRYMFEALIKMRDGLKLHGLWDLCERDYINYALHMCHWKYFVLDRRRRWALGGDFRANLLNEFDIAGRDQAFFFDEDDWAFLETVVHPSFAYRLISWCAYTAQRFSRLF